MHRVFVCVLAGLVTAFQAALCSAEESALTFAPLPLENPSLTTARNIELAALLGELLDRNVRVVLLPTYTEIIDGLTAGDIDLAELGPLPALLARERQPELQGIVSFRGPGGDADYRCAIVAAVDGVASLAALRDLTAENNPGANVRPLFLTRRNSTCGPLTTLPLLEEAGIASQQMSPRYSGTHEAVALSVLRAPRAIGSVKEGVARRYHALGLRVLNTSEPVPGFALLAHPKHVSQERLSVLRQSLLSLGERRLVDLDNGRYGFAAFDEHRYRELWTLRARAAPLIAELEAALPTRHLEGRRDAAETVRQ